MREVLARTAFVLVAVSSLCLATACARVARRASRIGDDGAEVRAARAEQNAALAASDYERVATFWIEGVVVTASLGRALTGREAYRRALELDSTIVYRREPEQIDVSAAWPLALERGSWTGRARGNGDRMSEIGGRYAAQWVRRDGRWLIRSELFVALRCAGAACSRALAVP